MFIFSGFNFNYIVAFERMHTILKLICYVGMLLFRILDVTLGMLRL